MKEFERNWKWEQGYWGKKECRECGYQRMKTLYLRDKDNSFKSIGLLCLYFKTIEIDSEKIQNFLIK